MDSTKQILIDEANKHKDRWGVHESHCCPKHGCKYGDADCPVVLGITDKRNTYCEYCEHEMENPDPLDLLEALNHRIAANAIMDEDHDVAILLAGKSLGLGMAIKCLDDPAAFAECGRKEGWWPRK